jgi:NhaP-type Na+/H+ or K+/H+ antiporter
MAFLQNVLYVWIFTEMNNSVEIYDKRKNTKRIAKVRTKRERKILGWFGFRGLRLPLKSG